MTVLFGALALGTLGLAGIMMGILVIAKAVGYWLHGGK